MKLTLFARDSSFLDHGVMIKLSLACCYIGCGAWMTINRVRSFRGDEPQHFIAPQADLSGTGLYTCYIHHDYYYFSAYKT